MHRTYHRWLLPLALGWSLRGAAAESYYAPTADSRHKLRVADAALARLVESQGGRALADYGGFRLLEVNRTALAETAGLDGVEVCDEEYEILLNAGRIEVLRPPAAPPGAAALAADGGARLHLVQFIGPIQPAWRQALVDTGARIVAYVPFNAYLVYGDAAARAAIGQLAQAAPHVAWQGPYPDSAKLQPRARRRIEAAAAQDAPLWFEIQMVDDPAANAATEAAIAAARVGAARQDYTLLGCRTLVVCLPPERAAALSERPDVISIRDYLEPRLRDERQAQIIAGNLAGAGPSGPGYLAWLADRGFTQEQFSASAFVVDVCDSGIDNGTTTPNHFGLRRLGAVDGVSRIAYSRREGTASPGGTIQGRDGHGTLNAHVIGGYNNLTATLVHRDKSGYRYGLGVCPFVRLGASVIFDPEYTDPNYRDMVSRAYRDGARISSCSWGAETRGDYDASSQAYDALVRDAQPAGAAVAAPGNQEMTIVFAAGNAGPGSQTVGSPGTAKNVFTIGAAENVHSHNTGNGGATSSGKDGCEVADSGADSSEDIASFSSRGPCADGRRKPDLVAPGTHVTGGVAQDYPPPSPSGTGSALPSFDATGVCALPGGGTPGSRYNFFPLNQQFFTTSSGTSHSTPGVSGACALLRQYFLNRGWDPPSPAMTKAYLMNAARYMTGVDANDTLWSANQGMGSAHLGMAFDGVPRILRDQVAADTFTASGQSRTFAGVVANPAKPVRVTLAWTDAPGSTAGAAFANNLDLVVRANAKTYRGNVFSGGLSTVGGAADARNNVESVWLPAGGAGEVVVTVTAANINSDGVPNVPPALDQDFALVLYNLAPRPTNQPPILDAIGDRIVATNAAVSFSVTASDFTDNDTIRLWAEGVPAWAVFPAVTNQTVATSTFAGTAGGPAFYTPTFYAADKDGTNSQTINLYVTASGVPLILLDEGFDGGTANPPAGWTLSGLIGTFNRPGYYGRSMPSLALWVGSQLTTPAFTNPVNVSFFARDTNRYSTSSMTLEGFDGTAWTSVGTLNPLPPFATNVTFSLNPNIQRLRFTPHLVNSVLAIDDVVVRGFEVPAPRRPPVLERIGPRGASVGRELQFQVRAQPTDGDAVTLSAGGLPAGALFLATNEVGTFVWTNAGPVGTYPTEFRAADADGSVAESVLITVAPPPAGGGGRETFDALTAPTNAFGDGTFLGASNVQWYYRGARRVEPEYEIDGPTLAFGDSFLPERVLTSMPVPGGVGSLSLLYRRYQTVAGTRLLEVWINGAVVGVVSNANNTTNQTLELRDLNIPGAVTLEVKAAGAKPVAIDSLEWTGYAPLDVNGNEIPDEWELHYFGSLTNATDSDPDADGLTIWEEYVADTDPTNPASRLRIEALTGLDAAPMVEFDSSTARLYRLWGAAALESGLWSNLTPAVTGSGAALRLEDPAASTQRFYRVGVSLP